MLGDAEKPLVLTAESCFLSFGIHRNDVLQETISLSGNLMNNQSTFHGPILKKKTGNGIRISSFCIKVGVKVGFSTILNSNFTLDSRKSQPSLGWWYTYPSEKYELVDWDDEILN